MEGTAPGGWLSGTEQAAWRQLLTVQCRVRERLERDLHDAVGIGLGDYDVLVHLSEAPASALRMSELADRLLLSRSGLTRRIDGMVRRGWVNRRPCDDDGRGSLAELTTGGWDLLRQAAPVHVAGVRRYLIDPVSAGGRGAGASVNGAGALDGLTAGLGRIQRALDG
jgi:DNA-binding MarR family transcriptional regulator